MKMANIATCPRCATLYEAHSEEETNSPTRQCRGCTARDTATHWAEDLHTGMAILLRKVDENCSECGEQNEYIWQPVDQEGGPGPSCTLCLVSGGLQYPKDLPCTVPIGFYQGRPVYHEEKQ